MLGISDNDPRKLKHFLNINEYNYVRKLALFFLMITDDFLTVSYIRYKQIRSCTYVYVNACLHASLVVVTYINKIYLKNMIMQCRDVSGAQTDSRPAKEERRSYD